MTHCTPHDIESLIEKYSINCGDWASYDDYRDLMYCGWMKPHNDIGFGATRSKPHMTLKVIYSDPDARLVHRASKLLIYTKLIAGDVVTFDASVNHALLPVIVADRIIDKQRWDIASMKFRKHENTMDTKVRLIWKWVD